MNKRVLKGLGILLRVAALFSIPALALGAPLGSEPMYLLLCGCALLSLGTMSRDTQAPAGSRIPTGLVNAQHPMTSTTLKHSES